MTVEHPGGRIPRPIGPTPREVDEVNRGTGRPKTARRVTDSRLLRLVAVLGAAAGVFQIGHKVDSRIPDVPGIYDDIRDVLGNLEPDSGPPSKGDIFNSKASSGEISKANIAFVPMQEALKVAHDASTKEDTMVLPLLFDPGESTVHYKIGGEVGPNSIEFTGIKKGTIVYAPADGELIWNKSVQLDNGFTSTNITIDGISLPWTTPQNTKGAKLKLFIAGTDFSPLIPEGSFTHRTDHINNGQTAVDVSEATVHVKAGQAIFTVISEANYATYNAQILIGSTIVGTAGTDSYSEQHGPSFSRVYLSFSSYGDKAIAVKPEQ